jgi:hypothetical protein
MKPDEAVREKLIRRRAAHGWAFQDYTEEQVAGIRTWRTEELS